MRPKTGRRDQPAILRDMYQRIQALERYTQEIPMIPFVLVSGASTNTVNIFAGPVLYRGHFIANTAGEFRYVHLYNKASVPTGADVPEMVLGIPFESGANQEYSQGVEDFDLGLSMAISTSPSSLVAVGAGDVVVNIFYSEA